MLYAKEFHSSEVTYCAFFSWIIIGSLFVLCFFLTLTIFVLITDWKVICYGPVLLVSEILLMHWIWKRHFKRRYLTQIFIDSWFTCLWGWNWIQGSETSDISFVTPGNYPKENIFHRLIFPTIILTVDMIPQTANIYRIPPTRFGHSCSHPEEGPLQRIITSKFYRSFWNNAKI